MDKTFYRLHSLHAGTGNVPDLSVGQTGICREKDDTSQIGCLVDSDPCSVGLGGREAARSYPGLVGGTGFPVPQPANLKALAVNAIPPFTPGADPDLALKNLLVTGASPFYPLAHRLYVTSIYGFGKLIGGEKYLADCYSNNAIVTPAVAFWGSRFVPIPGGVQCLDYPEQLTLTYPVDPNSQGSNPALLLPGCNERFPGNNACTDPTTKPNIIN